MSDPLRVIFSFAIAAGEMSGPSFPVTQRDATPWVFKARLKGRANLAKEACWPLEPP